MSDSDYLRQALTTATSVLGDGATKAIIEDLRRSSVFLNDPDLTLEKLARGINLIIGDKAGNLITERILLELEQLRNVPMIR